jgi:predicted dehydrogenase
MLRAAIVGLGRWGRTLVASCQGKSELVRFTAGVTRTVETARGFACSQGFEIGSDYEAVLRDPSVDAVVLATPHTQHAAQVEAAAAAGKHVFVEKPFALDLGSAERALAAAERAGIVLAFGHNRRFLPATTQIKSLIDAGDLGTILHAEGNFSGPGGYRYQPGMWRATEAESPTGGMAGLGIHVVDLLTHLVGEIDGVIAQSCRRALQIDMDDTTSMLFRFRNGAAGSLVTLTATAPLWRIQVFGSKGWVQMRGHDQIVLRRLDACPETVEFPSIDMERAELEAFARAVGGGPPYLVTAEEALHGIAVFEAIARSAQDGGWTPVAR